MTYDFYFGCIWMIGILLVLNFYSLRLSIFLVFESIFIFYCPRRDT
jgi:hypothetical protein